MNPKLKILVIDDTARYADTLKDFLEIIGHEVVVKHLPHEGIEAMNHTFDAVFIDHIYDNDTSMNGADVGWAIRKKYPLAALIMITGYWSEPENIRQFIWVGFDSFLPKHKEGDSIDSINKNREDALKTALNNAQRRIKSRFTAAELTDPNKVNVEQRLDFMERVYSIGGKDVKKLAIGVSLLEKNPAMGTKSNTEIDNEIENRYKAGNSQENATISAFFKVYSKGAKKSRKTQEDWRFVAEEPALKIRQLFKENPDKWPKIRKGHATVKAFIEDFNL